MAIDYKLLGGDSVLHTVAVYAGLAAVSGVLYLISCAVYNLYFVSTLGGHEPTTSQTG